MGAQAALQAEAAAILTDLDLAATVADVGPMLLAGSPRIPLPRRTRYPVTNRSRAG